MATEQKITWIVAAVVVAGLGALLLLPKVGKIFAPELVTAWVAIAPEGADVAEIGPVELGAGRGFKLYAVLEARGHGGEAIYYTEAPALSIGGRPVPAGALRRWNRPEPVKVLWFTVEGYVPYLELKPGDGLDRFRFEAYFRPEWGFGWTVPGTLDPAHDDRLVAEDRLPKLPFGTQRFQVRIELYKRDYVAELVPQARFSSPGPEAMAPVAAGAEAKPEPPRVTATLPAPAAAASAAFGLTEIAPPPGAGEALLDGIARPHPGPAGVRPGGAPRRHHRGRRPLHRRPGLAADLAGRPGAVGGGRGGRRRPPAGGRPGGGALSRRFAGRRRADTCSDAPAPPAPRAPHAADTGAPGALDRTDLCFDYVHGAAVRALGAVFAESKGEGGQVEWASLRPRLPP